jgi:DNA modification methylase
MRVVLKEIGYADALLAREDENGKLVLIDGHLRADTTPHEMVPVLVLDVNEAEGQKILATLDPLAAMAEVDDEALEQLITEIAPDSLEFGDLLASLNPRWPSGLVDEDAVPEPPASPVSRYGDLWKLGDHHLLCGNATLTEDVERLLSGVVPRIMPTDAPYGVNYHPAWRNRAFGESNRSVGEVRHDDQADWRNAWALYPGDIVYLWHAGIKAGVVIASLEACGFEIRSQIIWAKPHFVVSRGHYHVQHEPCLYAVRKGKTAHWQGDRTQTTLWSISNGLSQGGVRAPENELTGHGTQKPVECMRRPILNHTERGDAVYDPFVGSGSTIIAAETTGRIAYAIDIDPIYIDTAITRWQRFTGRTALLSATGDTFLEVAQSRKEGQHNA